MSLRANPGLVILVFVTLGWALPCWGQSAPQTPVPSPEQQTTGSSASEPLPDQRLYGSISGTVLDESGALVAGAQVRLAREDQSPAQQALSGSDGQFSFANIAPGPFQLTITSAGFALQTSSGVLHSGEIYTVPKIALAVAIAVSEVDVGLTQTEVAQEEIKVEEKQRVLGVIPNFYVTYDPNPVSLTAKQKFGLAWKMSVDPFSFVLIGGVAGIQQAQDDFDGYGPGAQGYAKRYGASYADFVTGTFIGAAILPSLLKQDPRYFYKGSGSRRSRILYALASSVICKGDNGHWQTNYSNILGSFAAGGISNLYYPAKDRGAELTFENSLIGIGATSAANLLQEFFIRKLTPKVPNRGSSQP